MAKGDYPEEITVTVLNWDKNNPRKDVKRAIWFKVYNDIFEDIKIRKLSSQQLVTYLWALSRCSIWGVDTFTTDTRQASHTSLHRNIPQFLRSLDALARYGLCTLDKDKEKIKTKTFRETKQENTLNSAASLRSERSVEPFAPLTDSGSKPPFVASLGNREGNTSLESGERVSPGVGHSPDLDTPPVVHKKRQPKKSILEPFSSDFELVWEIYPRHVAKRSAFVRYKRMITTEQDKENLIKAVTNYKNQCQSLRTEERYIKHLTSFIGTLNDQPWLDYVSNNETETRVRHLTNEELLAYLNGENT